MREKRVAGGYYETGLGALAAKLKAIGFKNYAEYLASDHWKMTRARVLAQRGRICQICQSTDVVAVHHRTYERLGSESDDDLVVLCGDHHRRVHHSERVGGKGGLDGALVRMIRRFNKKQKRGAKDRAIAAVLTVPVAPIGIEGGR